MNHQHTQKALLSNLVMWKRVFIPLLAIFYSSLLHAQSYMNPIVLRHGTVMAHSVVLDENGQPILVEYNEDGTEAGEVNVPAEYQSHIAELQIFDARDYHSERKRLDDFLELNADTLARDAEVMSASAFKQQTYLTADGNAQISIPLLSPSIKSVLVRGRSNRLTDDPEQLVLMKFGLDLSQTYIVPSTGSIVVNSEGNIVASSGLRIGPRTGFFGDPDKSMVENFGILRPEHTVFGPVAYAKVYADEFVFPGAVDVTDSEGKYRLKVRLPSCPGFDFHWTVDLYTDLRYSGFTPLGQPSLPYWLRRQTWSMCIGRHAILYTVAPGVYMDIEASLAGNVDVQQVDFKVDVMFLSGRVQVQNPDGSLVPVSDMTEYSAEALDANGVAQQEYDFDGDGEADRSVLGNLFEEIQPDGSTLDIFKAEPDDDGHYALQGVYFSSRSDQEGAPDIVRQADTARKLSANGLLKSISKEDLKNTDVLVFRESNGQLVMERKGLADEEIDGRDQVGLTDEDSAFYYRLMLRGIYDGSLNMGATNRRGSWEEWATRNKLEEPFQKREADHLKPGEWIRLVVINRATGYMGTQRVQLTDASQNSGNLSVPIEDMVLKPPRLKIWAERTYQVEHGLSADGEDRRFLIGAEGAGLVSDAMIEVYSEWYDHDGRPLPEGLSADEGRQYGLSGRLAKVVGIDKIQSVGGDATAIFPIGPGRQTQLLRIGDNLSQPEHFYIHVSGTAMLGDKDSKGPQFDAAGNAALEPFNSRPRTLTPFLAPLYDENKDWETYNAYRDLLREQADAETPDPDAVTPQKPLPSYVWSYRPEYQFSQYDLEIAEINRVNLNEQGEEEKENILDLTTPVISSGDQLIEFLYSFVGNTSNANSDGTGVLDRLRPIDGPQDLVLALGEEEVKLTLGQNQQIRIENIEHLASLSPEDFLTMRLYVNQDAGNILWEYAFEHLVLETQLAGYSAAAGQTLYVSADDPVVPLQARLIGYANRSPEVKEPVRVLWAAPGATLETVSEVDEDQGVFFNEVTLPNVAGATTQVSIKLMGIDETISQLPKFEVVPGAPARISVSQSDDGLSVGGIGQKTLTFTVRDQHNNLVTDGTGVSFFPEESLHLVSADSATTNGQASVTLRGGDFDGAARLRFNVGEKTEIVDIDVRPLNIAVAVNNSVNAGQSTTLQVTVTDADGNPVPNAEVQLGSTYGYLETTEVTTGSDGRAQTRFTAPQSEGQGQVTAQVGRSALQAASVTVVYPSNEERDLEVAHAAVIGDVANAGAINYPRYDGVNVGVAYPTSHVIQALGQEGDTVTVNIGDMHDPNLPPVAAYYMNQLYLNQVQDDAGRYPLFARSVFQTNGTRLGAGSSFRFGTTGSEGASKLWGNSLAGLNVPTSLGFAIEVFPLGESGGSLVNLGQGAQQLSYENMRFTYQIRTEAGTASVTSEPIFPGRWHQVAARYHNGQVELWVNHTRYSQSASGNLDYNWTGKPADTADAQGNHDLEIGGDFTGQLNSLKWYNWNAQPVLTFADGSTQTTVTIGSEGRTDLILQSTGNLHANGSQLGLQRVAIHTDKVRQYASLLSRETFELMAGQYVDTLAPDAPPINLAGLTPKHDVFGNAYYAQQPSLPLSALFPQAYAQGGFLDFGWSVVNFFLPIEDIGIVLQQMAYAVSDPDKFEPDEFIISLINVVTIFPPAKPLKLITVPLRSLFRSLKAVNPKFVKHFGGMFSGVMNKAKKGDFDTLWHLLPFFVIAVEMYNDPEARKGLEFMFSTVDSGEDILSWVDYLALPAEGWDGEGEIPEVDAFAVNTPPASLPLSFMMNQAHAQGRIIRVSGQVIGAALVKASKRISQEAAQNVPDALKVLARELKHADAATLRKYVFNPSAITAAVGITTNRGARAVGNFLKGKSNARYSPITVLATVAYIEWENACGKLLDIQAGEIEDASAEEVAGAADSLNELECGGKGITGVQNRREIYKLYGRAFADSASGKYDEEPMIDEGVNYEVFGYGHGALFHLNQIAHKQLLHRAGGPKIKEVEGNRWVWLYKDRDSLREGDGLIDKKSPDYKRYIYSAYNRRVDIILGNEGQPEQWHELKSYAAHEETGPGRELLAVTKGKSIEPWALGKGQELKGHSEVLHKQFSIDRAAANLKHARLQENTTTRLNDRVDISPDFKWLFQKFKVSPKPPKTTQVEIFPKFGRETDKKSIYGGLKQSIKNEEVVENKKIYETNMGASVSASQHIEHADLRAFLTSLAGIGFGEAADAIKDEIFEE